MLEVMMTHFFLYAFPCPRNTQAFTFRCQAFHASKMHDGSQMFAACVLGQLTSSLPSGILIGRSRSIDTRSRSKILFLNLANCSFKRFFQLIKSSINTTYVCVKSLPFSNIEPICFWALIPYKRLSTAQCTNYHKQRKNL